MAAIVNQLSPRSIPGHKDGHVSQHLNHGFDVFLNVRQDKYLEVSFYLEKEHQLNLDTVSTPNRLLALALTNLKPLDEKYATTQYESAFNWAEVMKRLKDLAAGERFSWKRQEFYVVEFRSKLKSNIDRPLLFQLDKESHREATQSGGLLKYWYGSPDFERRNLATCLWRSKEDAINGGKGPWHKKARVATGQMYEEINVKGLRLVIEEDLESWSFSPFS